MKKKYLFVLLPGCLIIWLVHSDFFIQESDLLNTKNTHKAIVRNVTDVHETTHQLLRRNSADIQGSDFSNDDFTDHVNNTINEETEIPHIDIDSLLSVATDTDNTYEKRTAALYRLLSMFADKNDRQFVFENLVMLKDHFSGEEQQFILKAISEFPEYDSNEAILDSFMKVVENNEGTNSIRMLSYINSRKPLSEEWCGKLQGIYENSPVLVRNAILDIIVSNGGRNGLEWIDRKLRLAVEQDKIQIYNSLGRNGNIDVLNYLNRLLDQQTGTNYPDEEEIDNIKSAIMQLNSRLK